MDTVNISDLANDIKQIKEGMKTKESMSTNARGHVEEGASEKFAVREAKALINMKFREFLNDKAAKTFTASEGLNAARETIGQQTAASAIPQMWSASPEILSPEGADGYFLTSIVEWKEDVRGKPGIFMNYAS